MLALDPESSFLSITRTGNSSYQKTAYYYAKIIGETKKEV
jgi:hypothetical protein